MIKQFLYLQETTTKGRGVFTRQNIDAGAVIEESPVIVMTAQDRVLLDKTLLHDYIFEWGNEKDQCCMALGYLSIYNHSYGSNCEYFMDFEEQTIRIKTIRAIKKGEELTINYNGDWNNNKKIWFDVV